MILNSLEEEEDKYIEEDWDTEATRNRKTAQQVQTAILQDLRQTLGVDATLPETTVKELVLQVIYLKEYFFNKNIHMYLRISSLSHSSQNVTLCIFRGLDGSRLVANSRRLPLNIKAKDLAVSTSPVPVPTPRSLLTCWKVCLGTSILMTWTHNSWRQMR